MSIRVKVVDAKRWADLETLFGPRGAYAGCWCMFWRIPGRQFHASSGAGNRKGLKSLVEAGEPVGLLAYSGDVPVGWAALAPRSAYQRLFRSTSLKPEPGEEDDAGVWSVPCLYIDRRHRGEGVATALLEAAPKVAKKAGARVLEAYPVDTTDGRKVANSELYTGTVTLLSRLGFTVHRRPPIGRKVVMRRAL